MAALNAFLIGSTKKARVSMFIIEWINNYINTPKQELTAADEAMFSLAVLIILAGMIVIGIVVTAIAGFIKERRDEKRRKKRKGR